MTSYLLISSPGDRASSPPDRRTQILRTRTFPQTVIPMPRPEIHIVLDRLRSAHNVGNIFRLADAVRAKEVICCGYTPASPHPKLARSAMGADRTVPFRHFDRILRGKYSFIIASNDHLASYIFQAAERKNLKIPEAFSICGVDDLPTTRDLNLTTVPLRPMDLGLAALDLLKKRLFMPDSCANPETMLIKCQLIIRNTTIPNTGDSYE